MIRLYPQTCPWCGHPAGHPVINETGRIITLNYLCPNQHAFMIKTLKPEAT